MINLTVQALRASLSYAPETGVFTWLATASNRVKVGEVAGTRLSNGYLMVGVGGERFLSHRLAWFWMTGEWPLGEIDHINGRRDDNRWTNLRDVSHSENAQNVLKPRANNRARLRGVSPNKKRWMAQITVNRICRHLGTYDTPEEAHAAYSAAKRLLHIPTSPS